MNKEKKLIIEIIIFIISLIIITYIYNYITIKNTSINNENITNEKQINKIVEIKDEKHFEQEVINNEGTVFVDFYARWCIPCKTMSPIIEELSKEYDNIKFIKIDIDKNEELSIKYNISNIPTMLIMEKGKITKTFIGITDKEEIVKYF